MMISEEKLASGSCAVGCCTRCGKPAVANRFLCMACYEFLREQFDEADDDDE